MKRISLSVFAAVAFAGFAWGLATPTQEAAPAASLLELTAPVVNPFEGPAVCADADELAPPSCEKGCERDYDKCLRQGNDESYCFDSVFCACMCNECNNCVC